MNCYPNEHSVLVMDNCRIHHSEVLKEALNSEGTHPLPCMLLGHVTDTSTARYHDPISATVFT